MAGQPPEPSFQPSGPDQTQARPAWQQPSYPPPPPPSSPAGGQPAYTPAPPSYGSQDQARVAPDPGYPAQDQGYGQSRPQDQGYGQDQTYTALGQNPGQGQDYQSQSQSQGQDYQGYQGGYQPPSYGAQPGQSQGMPQWQGVAGASSAKKTKQPGEKGFIGSLFDFSFNTFVTPKIIKVLYVLLTLWTALVGLILLVLGFRTGGLAGGLFTLIIVEPIFVLLTLGIYRVVLEAFMVVFRIYEEVKQVRENSQSQG
jgi:hypothetical protein